MKLLERSVATIDQRLVLLAPSGAAVLPVFRNRATDAGRHRAFVLEMQQLRGGIYLRDGAVERRHLAPDGAHRTPEDERSWHLLMLNSEGRVSACAWYLRHEAGGRGVADAPVPSPNGESRTGAVCRHCGHAQAPREGSAMEKSAAGPR